MLRWEIGWEKFGGKMASVERIKTEYPGVYYREVRRIGKSGLEKVYYIRFKKEGKVVEEKVGRQYQDNMTPAKASGIRAERIEGKRKSRREIRIKKEAENFANKTRPTINFIWEKYKEVRHNQSFLYDQSLFYKNYLQAFYDKTPSEIFTDNIQNLRKQLESKKLAPSSVRHVMTLLRTLINFGVKNGLCEDVPRSQLYFQMPKVDNQKTEMLSEEQLVALFKALDEEPDQNAAAFMRLALATGMRKSALMNLRWDDIDFDYGVITLRGDVAKKGKTERIPINASARQILKNIIRGESLYVFPGKDGGPRKEFRRIAERVKRKAGLPEDFRPLHGLRHTYASLLASSGEVDLYTLQKLLTHSSPQMTQRYAHLADEALQRASGVMDKFLKKKGD